jgi:hypothetical protein
LKQQPTEAAAADAVAGPSSFRAFRNSFSRPRVVHCIVRKMGVCTALAALIGLVSLPSYASAATKTIGPITTTSGVSCYLSNSIQNSTSSLGVPDLTYGSSWSCTASAGSKPISSDSSLSDELREQVLGQTTTTSVNVWQESCTDSYHCSQSAHNRRLPAATYRVTSSPTLRSYHVLNGDWSDDDFFESWPAGQCQAFTSFPFEPGPDTVRCTFSVNL